jgi:hypothetical protein
MYLASTPHRTLVMRCRSLANAASEEDAGQDDD